MQKKQLFVVFPKVSNVQLHLFSRYSLLFYYIVLFYSVVIPNGCIEKPEVQNVLKPKNDTLTSYTCDYAAAQLQATQTKPEYKKYYFKKNEERRIFIYGKVINPSGTKISLDNTGNMIWTVGCFSSGADAYLEDKSTHYEGVLSILGKAGQTLGKFKPTLSYASAEDYPEIIIGDDRKYFIQFNCMLGYNIFNTYPDSLPQHIKKVFNSVNTEISIYNNNTFMTPISLGSAPNYRETIWRYIKNEGLEFANNWVYLTGLSACTALSSYGGITIYIPKTYLPTSGEVGIQYAIPCYFGTHISKIAIGARLSTESTGRLFAYCILHELAHARAMEFTVEDGYPAPGYTLSNDEHTTGHDGVGKYTCLMFIPDEGRLFDLLNTLDICSGHKQMLFNAKFKP